MLICYVDESGDTGALVPSERCINKFRPFCSLVAGFWWGGRGRGEGLRVQSFRRNAPGVVPYRLRNAASNVLMFL